MFLYVIQKVPEEIYKIGFSKSPETRIKNLQTGNEAILRFVAILEHIEAPYLEKRLHNMLWQHRINPNGEWFRLDKERLDFVKEWLADQKETPQVVEGGC
jgi:hypothetical protein